MKHSAKITSLSLICAGLVTVAVLGLPEGVEAQSDQTLLFDVACDCRTGSPLFFTGVRGDAWIVSGKIFPAGTLPTGTATNDPTLPVGGIAPIGDWTCRGQSAFPFPPTVNGAYNNTPFAFNTQYFLFHSSRAMTVEGWAIPTGEKLSITGGTGGFSGATGDVEEGPFGTNATGCPNFRARFNVRAGSIRGPIF